MEYESPFDQVLASSPLLLSSLSFSAAPMSTSRWSFWNKTTTTTKTTPSTKSNNNKNKKSETYPKNDTAPVMEIQFVAGPPHDDDHQDDDCLDLLRMEQGGIIMDLDTAVMQERHDGIQSIHSAMVQMNEIRKDLALVVQSQQEHVQAAHDHVQDATVQAASGLSHLQATVASSRRRHRQRHLLLAAAVTGAAILLLGSSSAARHCWWKNRHSSRQYDGSNATTSIHHQYRLAEPPTQP